MSKFRNFSTEEQNIQEKNKAIKDCSASETKLKPILCTFSIIFRFNFLVIINKKEPCSSLHCMRDLYIYLRSNNFDPQEV